MWMYSMAIIASNLTTSYKAGNALTEGAEHSLFICSEYFHYTYTLISKTMLFL